jgi:hypothetical protein
MMQAIAARTSRDTMPNRRLLLAAAGERADGRRRRGQAKTPAEFAKLVKSELECWGPTVNASGFSPED